MICFALCLSLVTRVSLLVACKTSFITRGLQNKDHSTFACCLAQTNFEKETNLENCVRLFKIL